MRHWKIVAGSALAAAGLLVVWGCETEPANTQVRVTPSSVVLREGESAEFVASGGFDYTWSLDSQNTHLGFLSTRTGDRTVYTSLASPGSNATDVVVRVLTVQSRVPTSTGTNAVPVEWTAAAHITQL